MIKTLAKKLFISFGGLDLLRCVTNLISGKSITIIYGHRVLPDHILEDLNNPNTISGQTSVSEVKRLIQVLEKRFKFISMDDAIEKIGSNKIDNNYLVLTFDDGFSDNYEYLLPILLENKIPATYYVNTSVIDSNENLWFQSVINLFFSIQEKSIHIERFNQKYDLSTSTLRFESAMSFMKFLQSKFEPEEFMPIIKTINGSGYLPKDTDKHLTWDQLRKLINEPLITIGAHSSRHFPLTLCDIELAKSEISLSKNLLEKKLDTKIKHFSFPRGYETDFNNSHIEHIKQLGMKSSTTTIRGNNKLASDLYQLKRVGLPAKTIGKEDELLWYVYAMPQLISSIKRFFKP